MADTTANTSYDAQRLTEEIEAGEVAEPKMNIQSDYEHSQAYATSEVDEQNSTPATTQGEGKLTGDQEMFREMAKKVMPDSDE